MIKLKGVKRAEVDLNHDTVTMDYDEAQVNLVTMKEMIEEAGYRR